jgi:hypothetical protein
MLAHAVDASDRRRTGVIFIAAKFQVLPEAFRDDAAGAAHVQSDHFKKAQQTLPPHLAATPKIVNFTIPQDDWSALGELAVPERG